MWLGRHPIGAERPIEQNAGLGAGEHREAKVPGAIMGDEAVESLAARDDHRTARSARQERPNLAGVGHVVQHDEDASVGEQAAVGSGRVIDVARHALTGHAERPQEPGQRIGRPRRRAGGVPAHVGEELAVREALADVVCPSHGERGLAHTGGAGDHRDTSVGLIRLTIRHEHAIERVELGLTSDERGSVERQLGWCHHRRDLDPG